MGDGEQLGDPVHHRTGIVPVAFHAGARMQRDAHLDEQIRTARAQYPLPAR
jgi:hypothetical protein